MKNSVSSKKEELRQQLENMDFYELIEGYFNSVISSCNSDIEMWSTTLKKTGTETEQAKNWNGELLFCSDETNYGRTLENLEGETNIRPYYNDIYERFPNENLDDWDKRHIAAAKQVLDFIEKIDIFKTFKPWNSISITGL